jgi:hypothetical protein
MPKSFRPEADRDLYSGLIRLHVLHHAAEEPIFGLGMAEELDRQEQGSRVVCWALRAPIVKRTGGL